LQSEGPDGARISREHLLEVSILAKPIAPESPQRLPRPHSTPAIPQHESDMAEAVLAPSAFAAAAAAAMADSPDAAGSLEAAAPSGGAGGSRKVSVSSGSGGSRAVGSSGSMKASPADGWEAAVEGASPRTDWQSLEGAASNEAASSPAAPAGGHAASAPADLQASLLDQGPRPQLRVATALPPAAEAAAAPDAAAEAGAEGEAGSSGGTAAEGEPAGPATPPHSPPRVSLGGERLEQSADEDSGHSPTHLAATAGERQRVGWDDLPGTAAAAEAAAVDTQAGGAAEAFAAAERHDAAAADNWQQEAEPPADPPVKGVEQFSILVRNCRALGPGLPPSLAAGTGFQHEAVICELMPQVYSPLLRRVYDTKYKHIMVFRNAECRRSLKCVRDCISHMRVAQGRCTICRAPLVHEEPRLANGSHMCGWFTLQESSADAAIRLDMPHLLLRLPVSSPPAHPDRHPAEEATGAFTDYARRPGGAFAKQAPAGQPKKLPMTTCTASDVALYLAANSGDASNIARRLPVLLLPRLALATTAVRGQQDAAEADEAGEAAPGKPRWQPAAYTLDVGPLEAALQPGQLHTALAAGAAAGQDWARICGDYANKAQPDTVSSQLGGADLLSQVLLSSSIGQHCSHGSLRNMYTSTKCVSNEQQRGQK